MYHDRCFHDSGGLEIFGILTLTIDQLEREHNYWHPFYHLNPNLYELHGYNSIPDIANPLPRPTVIELNSINMLGKLTKRTMENSKIPNPAHKINHRSPTP